MFTEKTMHSTKSSAGSSWVVSILLAMAVGGMLQAQEKERQPLKGILICEGADVSGVHIRNLSTGRATISDLSGNFSIDVMVTDTLLLSAVQFWRKTLVIDNNMLNSRLVRIALEEFTNQLDEVILRPFGLSGDIWTDMGKMETGPIITATTLDLPNARVRPPTQNERKLYTARTWEFKGTSVKLDPVINYFSGRTAMLKKRVARDLKYKFSDSIGVVYSDAHFRFGLMIPEEHKYNFLNYCEVDAGFDTVIASGNEYELWRFLRKKSFAYRENNGLD